jgi:hypothetical protein
MPSPGRSMRFIVAQKLLLGPAPDHIRPPKRTDHLGEASVRGVSGGCRWSRGRDPQCRRHWGCANRPGPASPMRTTTGPWQTRPSTFVRISSCSVSAGEEIGVNSSVLVRGDNPSGSEHECEDMCAKRPIARSSGLADGRWPANVPISQHVCANQSAGGGGEGGAWTAQQWRIWLFRHSRGTAKL